MLLLLLGVCFAFADDRTVPQVLIVQLRDPLVEGASPKQDAADPNINIADPLAQFLDEDGRVEPIVWGITDPLFREDIAKANLGSIGAEPTLAEAQRVAAKLGWEYVMVVKAVRRGSDVLGQAKLYRGGQLWQDPQPIDGRQLGMMRKLLKQKKMTQAQYDDYVAQQEYLHLSVQASGNDEQALERAEENTAKSIANTWASAVTGGPLRSLQVKRRRSTPQPSPGQGPTPPIDNPKPPVNDKPPIKPPTDPPKGNTNPPPAQTSNESLKANLKSLLDNKQLNAAISLLRDGIDAAPLDVERRSLLIELLNNSGMHEQAAVTARQAAAILPDKPILRVLAARAWMEAGKPEEAQTDLNEAVARDPDSSDVRLLLAQVAMGKGDLPAAMGHLSAAISKHPESALYFERALAEAIAGNGTASQADLAKATELGLGAEGAASRYREAAQQVDRAIERDTDALRQIVQKAALNRKDPAIRVALERAITVAGARGAFFDKLSVPSGHQKSHDQRSLAFKLLVQCLGDVRSYIESGDDDALSDARLNLGEALGGLASARQQFDREAAPPGSNEQS